jgi:hypothetical protein
MVESTATTVFIFAVLFNNLLFDVGLRLFKANFLFVWEHVSTMNDEDRRQIAAALESADEPTIRKIIREAESFLDAQLKAGLAADQALAFHPFHSGDGPINVAASESDAVIIPEIELGQITMQVFFLAVLIDAIHAAFENRERALDGVRVNVAANVFLDRVLDRFVGGEVSIRAGIEAAFIGMQAGFPFHVFGHDARDSILVGNRNVE